MGGAIDHANVYGADGTRLGRIEVDSSDGVYRTGCSRCVWTDTFKELPEAWSAIEDHATGHDEGRSDNDLD